MNHQCWRVLPPLLPCTVVFFRFVRYVFISPWSMPSGLGGGLSRLSRWISEVSAGIYLAVQGETVPQVNG